MEEKDKPRPFWYYGLSTAAGAFVMSYLHALLYAVLKMAGCDYLAQWASYGQWSFVSICGAAIVATLASEL